MSRNYFVSDIHLGINNQKKEEKFLSFLSIIKEKDTLFILGDLFEYFLEYYTVIPKNCLKVLIKLKELQEKGVKVYYLGGNHDYGILKFLKREFNFIIGDKYFDLIIENKRVYISHGDFIDNSFLTKLSRLMTKNPINQFFYSFLHPDIGLPLAQFFIHFSRKKEGNLNLKEEFYNFAKEKITKEKYDIVVLGHLHIPTLIKIEKGYYLNTGDWVNNYTYGVIEKDLIELKKY
ncbi:MAG: UDP-2,3-diacylglucosamine diphosphatase [candidate division WOR-3 bacterium]|nr:UDP-2,3-diacylglucosamine diphosphatase [candidate division WOR-3 bacterium]MCX7837656.1 UDP-2,3-diacylglucosamine diphosphatase [candidate division WOR-3 bacterium]MDW8114023.1 UDP-2,3-diacylglucosamine diphosphatase [candidate division WOR-3 bacterium]